MGMYLNPTAKGFEESLKAVVIELKVDKSATGAHAQIREKKYPDALKEYKGQLILAGINYDRETKKHTCLISREG